MFDRLGEYLAETVLQPDTRAFIAAARPLQDTECKDPAAQAASHGARCIV